MLPLQCFLIIIIATVLPFLLSVYVSLATATIITALDYELLISHDRACARWGGQRERRRREDSRRDAWRTFLSPINESTKYHPYTLALSRLVIIKRYKREADCAGWLPFSGEQTHAKRNERNFTVVCWRMTLLHGGEKRVS